MVNRPSHRILLSRHGAILFEMMLSLFILLTVVIPLAAWMMMDQKILRSHYFRAVATEIVDGEMEILAAGEWKSWADGTFPYPIRAESAQQLPRGNFTLTKTGEIIRLEWQPEKSRHGGRVMREVHR